MCFVHLYIIRAGEANLVLNRLSMFSQLRSKQEQQLALFYGGCSFQRKQMFCVHFPDIEFEPECQ